MERIDVLAQLGRELGMLRGRRGQRVLQRWGEACPGLAKAGLARPADVPEWVSSLEHDEANEVLRHLVRLAQGGDDAAVLAVLLSLRWGLCAIAGREAAGLEEVMDEAAVVVLEYPLRRPEVMAGLLLDVRHRFWARRRRWSREPASGDTRRHLETAEAPGDLGRGWSAAEQLLDLVYRAWRAGRISEDEARLIIETRILGDRISAASARRDVTVSMAMEKSPLMAR